MRRARLLIPILLALAVAACAGQQANYLAAGQPQTAQIQERGLFTGNGPFASQQSAPTYAPPAYAQVSPYPQNNYAAAAYPQRQPQNQQAYGAQAAAPQRQASAADGRVMQQRYGPHSYVMQYQRPPQATGGPYVAAPYGYATPHPASYRPSPVY